MSLTRGGFVSSVDVVNVLRERLAEDEKFISDHHGCCREYPQNARVEFVTELVDKHEHWANKAESWDYAEDYCNERAEFLNGLLLLIANNWEDYER
jgi:hypothetical protein